ncbi:MAG: response regulator transcription factor [Lachnospiraceae bacterium]|nr:response regulator transcription factor [Lachnospiraceae bacterium]
MIWCVEDDENIREIEVYSLRSTGFEARGFAEGRSFFAALEKEKPDLILLDIMLPEMDGVAILQRLKADKGTADIPVIMATAKGAEHEKVRSLDIGADDYLVKPFGMMEMVSRVKAVLRRCKKDGSDVLLKAGGILLHKEERTVSVDGARIELTFKEFELLRLFLEKPGTAFSREQLFLRVWGDNYVGETRTLDMHIRTLRSKLGKYGGMIETVRGVGYRLEDKA